MTYNNPLLTKLVKSRGLHIAAIFAAKCYTGVFGLFLFWGRGREKFRSLCISLFISFYHKIQITIKQDSYSQANASDEESQKETMRHIDIGLP